MVVSQALNLNNQVDAVPENIRQLVSLISSVIRRINEKQLDISGNKCLYINNNERNFNNGRQDRNTAVAATANFIKGELHPQVY